MSSQKNILLVTNSTSDNELILIKEAFSQANNQGFKAKLNLVHVIPNLPMCYFNIPSMMLLAEKYYDEASKVLTEIGSALEIPKKDQWLISGRIKTEVLRLAHKLDIHFILASSSSIQDLHKSYLFARKEHNATPIRSISSLVAL